VRTVAGQDDLAAVAEVAKRRFARVKRGEDQPPDLFVVDGGPNQLAAAARAIAEAGFEGQTAAAFAKDPDRLFVPGSREAAAISEAATLFLARVRDEAHRFAVEYHRKVRDRAASKSILDEVAGIGPARKKALLRHFGSVEKITSVPEAELARAPKMTKRAAQVLFDYLHGAREGEA
jgi:excinuclease ABC subunit C